MEGSERLLANIENLKPQNTRTKEEQREIARLGGKASGESRRAKSSIRSILKTWADSPISVKELKTEAKKYGIKTNEGRSLIALALIRESLNGNSKYMEHLLNILNEDAQAEAITNDGFAEAIKGTASEDWEESEDV